MAVDEEGYFSPEKMNEIIKKKMKKRQETSAKKADEEQVLSEGWKWVSSPLESGEDVEKRKKYSETIMRRIKRSSPRT